MRTGILYQLTMRCDFEHCELDFGFRKIMKVDSAYVYLKDRKVRREYLGTIIPQYSLNKVLLTSFFIPKETVLIIVRQMCLFLYYECGALFKSAELEWEKLRFPSYDEQWFAGNVKAEQWEKEFRQQAWEPIENNELEV